MSEDVKEGRLKNDDYMKINTPTVSIIFYKIL
jgi:hypothetical protein